MNTFDTRPNLPDILAAEWSQQDMAIAASRHRAGRPTARAEFHRLRYSATIAIARHIPALVLGFIAGLAAIAIPAIILTRGAIL